MILVLVFAFWPIQGYSQQYTPTWDELRIGLYSNDENSLNYLFQIKSNLENKIAWTDTDHGVYQSAIRLLSDYTSRQGLYDVQEKVLFDALKNYVLRDSSGNNKYIRDVLCSMIVLYCNVHDYENAIKCGIEAIQLHKDADDYGLEYVSLMHNMASGAISNKEYESAKQFVEEGMSIFSQIEDKEGITDFRLKCYLLNLRGRIAFHENQYAQAENFYTQCIELSALNQYANILKLAENNLAVLYYKQKEYDKALSIFEILNANSPTPENLINILQLRYDTNTGSEGVISELTNYNNLRYSQAIHTINSRGESERNNFLNDISHEMIWYNNLIAGRFPETAKEAFDANLFGRNISISVNIALRNAVSFQNTDFKSELSELRNQLTLKSSSDEEMEAAYERVSEIEKHLFSTNETILKDEIEYVGSWDVIRPYLTSEDVMLLFCYMPKVTNNVQSCDYAVYIGTSDMVNPLLLDLCVVDDLEDLILNNISDPVSISELYSKDYNAVFKMIWERIIPYIIDKKNVYYTPAGVLSMVNNEGLPYNGKTIGECFNMKMISSPTRIKDRDDFNQLKSICLFGSPNFNMDVDDMVSNASKFSHFSGNGIFEDLNMTELTLRSGWSELPGTYHEVILLDSLLTSGKYIVHTFINENASEEQFKSISGSSPEIIHIASHGFSYTVGQEENALSGSNYQENICGISLENALMQLSGILLSGGNNTWLGKSIPYGTEDGILTAEEISRLDLSNTNLVVLSACDTGLGHIDPVEGVWGLQRAFKQAGVKSILMTLWKIPDNITTMFMQEFYHQLLEGQDIHQSLKNAQSYLKTNGASDPYYWASFILLDAF